MCGYVHCTQQQLYAHHVCICVFELLEYSDAVKLGNNTLVALSEQIMTVKAQPIHEVYTRWYYRLKVEICYQPSLIQTLP